LLGTVLGVLGALVVCSRLWGAKWPLPWRRAIVSLSMAGIFVWANAVLRLHPVEYKPFLPVARYAYPAIVPTALALAGGWWTLTPRRVRRWFLLGVFALLGALDIASLWTLSSFFYGRW